MILILLRRCLRIEFAAQPSNRLFRNRGWRQQSFPGHSKVAFRIVRRHATLVSERDPNQIPWQITPDRRKPSVNRSRGVSARERNPEFVTFAKSVLRLRENEISRVGDEIFGANNLRFSFHE